MTKTDMRLLQEKADALEAKYDDANQEAMNAYEQWVSGLTQEEHIQELRDQIKENTYFVSASHVKALLKAYDDLIKER